MTESFIVLPSESNFSLSSKYTVTFMLAVAFQVINVSIILYRIGFDTFIDVIVI